MKTINLQNLETQHTPSTKHKENHTKRHHNQLIKASNKGQRKKINYIQRNKDKNNIFLVENNASWKNAKQYFITKKCFNQSRIYMQ